MTTDGDDAPYRDPSLPVPERVADLVDRMTLAEKAGQVVGTWAGALRGQKTVGDVEREITDHGIGAVATFGWAGGATDRLASAVETVNALQEVAATETRLGIPLLCNVDAIHGHAYVTEATAFPNGLGLAATRDAALVEDVARTTATEVRATGAHRTYAPTCDVARDPRWGRTFETFGESPFLCGSMAAAKVRGYQGDGLDDPTAALATAKHFPAYGDPVRGEDAAPVEVSDYRLRTTFLPPFVAAVETGVDSVMPSYNAVDGEPTHASYRYLTGLLRDELGFSGSVVSDWNGICHLHADHGVSDSHRASVRMARQAGVDEASVGAVEHAERLVSLVEAGEVSESLLDESVGRVLERKFRLGLFEDPLVDASEARAIVGCDAHRDLALDAARETMTLLANDGLLPLDSDADVLVAGPNADAPVHQLGGWSVHDDAGAGVVTIREGIESLADGDVTYEQGATITDRGDLDAAAEAARDADVAVIAVGEPWYIHEFGPSALSGTDPEEFPRRSELHLPDAQRALVKRIHETGTPVVGVLVTGRPLIVDWLAQHAPALLLAYYPGTMGGLAVAETLFGDSDPGGRLPMSMPKSAGDLPTTVDRWPHPTPIGADEHPDSYDPLYPFGHGLSYAEFEYGEATLADERVAADDSTTVEVPVENTSDRAGTEVVDVFVRDARGSRVRPKRQLRGFARVDLGPGEERTVSVPVDGSRPWETGVASGDRAPAGEISVFVGEQELALTIE